MGRYIIFASMLHAYSFLVSSILYETIPKNSSKEQENNMSYRVFQNIETQLYIIFINCINHIYLKNT